MFATKLFITISCLFFWLGFLIQCESKSQSPKEAAVTTTTTSTYTNTYTGTSTTTITNTATLTGTGVVNSTTCSQSAIASRLIITQSIAASGDILTGQYNVPVNWSFVVTQSDNAGHDVRIIKITPQTVPTGMTTTTTGITWTPTTASPVSGTVIVSARDLSCCNFIYSSNPSNCTNTMDLNEDVRKTFTWNIGNTALTYTYTNTGTIGMIDTGGMGSMLSGGGLGSILQILMGLLSGGDGGYGSGLGGCGLFGNFSQIFSGLYGGNGLGGGGLGGMMIIPNGNNYNGLINPYSNTYTGTYSNTYTGTYSNTYTNTNTYYGTNTNTYYNQYGSQQCNGNGFCEPNLGETVANCPSDCP